MKMDFTFCSLSLLFIFFQYFDRSGEDETLKFNKKEKKGANSKWERAESVSEATTQKKKYVVVYCR